MCTALWVERCSPWPVLRRRAEAAKGGEGPWAPGCLLRPSIAYMFLSKWVRRLWVRVLLSSMILCLVVIRLADLLKLSLPVRCASVREQSPVLKVPPLPSRDVPKL